MKKEIILIILMSLSIAAWSKTSSQSNRLLQVEITTSSSKVCASFPDRNALIDEKAKIEAAKNRAAINSAFKLSGNQLVGAVVSDPDGLFGGIVNQGPKYYTDLGIYAGPFGLGLIITLLIWPFLCCCCCCPECCPPRCCQNANEQEYQKSKLYWWPAVVLILAFLLLLVPGVIGISKIGEIQNSYKAVMCAFGITYDDILIGNTSSTGKRFMGTTGMIAALDQLNTNINAVQTQLNNIKFSNAGGAVRAAYDEGTTLLDDLSSVPDNSVGGALGSYTYNHFDGSAGTIQSIFPVILGTAATGSQSGAMKISYDAVNQINQNLKTAADGAQAFIDGFATMDNITRQFSASMKSVSDFFILSNRNLNSIDDFFTSIKDTSRLAVTCFVGVIIGLAALGIFGTILMACCQKYRCRYLLYFICVILFVFAIIIFLLAVSFSISAPILSLTCDFFTVSTANSTAFKQNLGGELGSYLSVCLPGGSGDFINQFQGVDLSALNGMNDAILSMNAFDATVVRDQVDTALTTLQELIHKYYYTDQFDFSSSYDKNFMAKIANPANYPTCTVSGFQTDSWVPSIRQTYVRCPSAISGTTATDTDCPNSGVIQARSGTCQGCMDTTKIIDNTANFVADITARYSGCASYIADMTLLHNNYYTVKNAQLASIKTRIDNVVTSYTAASGYYDKLGDVGTAFASSLTALTSVVSTVVDPNNGMVAGLNCLVLGEDINLIVSTTCNQLFNSFYFLRLAFGISAFAILFSLCCTTWSGVRAYKISIQNIGEIYKQPEVVLHQQATLGFINDQK